MPVRSTPNKRKQLQCPHCQCQLSYTESIARDQLHPQFIYSDKCLRHVIIGSTMHLEVSYHCRACDRAFTQLYTPSYHVEARSKKSRAGHGTKLVTDGVASRKIE